MTGWTGSHSIVPNDIFKLKRGELWRDTLTVSVSGTSGNPITYEDYGSGDQPIISGADEVQGWELVSGNKWKATWASAEQVWFTETDGSIVRGREVANTAALVQEYDWVVDSGELWCYTAPTDGDPDTRYSSVEDSVRAMTITGNGYDYIHVKNIEVKFPYDHGIRPANAEYWLIDNCTVNWIGETQTSAYGIFLVSTLGCTVSNCSVSQVAWRGICVYTDNYNDARSQDTIIEYCTVFNNMHTDIELRIAGTDEIGGTFDGCIIRYCHIYHDSDHDMTKTCNGIYSDNQISENDIENVDIYYCLIHDIAGYGINPRNGSLNWDIYNNVIGRKLDGFTAVTCHGITFGTDPHGGINIKNNIVFDYDGYCLYIGDKTLVGVCDNNCWYNSVGSVYARINSVNYGSGDFAAYKTATGWDTNGLWEDPKFVDKAGSDFHLASNSPCRNAGVDVSLTPDYDEVTVPRETNPAIGAFEFVSAGSSKLVKVVNGEET
jgi:parallel beta-helix repeat protein